jgi:signal transduction histidine kinase
MTNEHKLMRWHNWTLIGLRCVFLLLAWLELSNGQASDATPFSPGDTATVLTVGILLTILVLIPALFPKLSFILNPFVLIGDWIIMALVTYTSGADTTLMIANGALLIFSSALRLGPGWGVAHTIGIMLIGLFTAREVLRLQEPLQAIGIQSLPLILLALFGVAANAWAYSFRRHIQEQQAELAAIEKSKKIQIADLQERTRAIYDMAAVLSSTLHYEKILHAAMNAGWLGLRQREREIEERLISAMLLFSTEDNMLHVIVGRGLTLADERRFIPGIEGYVGEALKQCIPIFGASARKDPELGNFVAFQMTRSVMVIPLRAGYDNFGAMVYGSPLPDAFTDEHIELLTAIGTQATVALQNAHLYQNLLEERDKMVEVEEEARKKLARDLHDGPTQNVSAIAMRMGVIQKLLEKSPDEVANELKKIEDLARRTTKEIRHMLFTLRPLVLENQGLAAALSQLAEKMKETYNQNVTIRVSREAEKSLDSHQQGTLFYIIEEAVNNARKHAQAETISVMVNRQDDLVTVSIADNGVGFDIDSIMGDYTKRGSLGMVNLRERAEMINGSLQMESAKGKGTSITVLIPVREHGINGQAVTRTQVSPSVAPAARTTVTMQPIRRPVNSS